MSMRKLLAAFLISLPMALFAQNAIVQEGEFGFGVGAGHYFGDLNTKAKLNRPKIAAGIFFRKNFGNYIAVRLAGNFAQLGFSDVYNEHNEYMRRRNLSFNTKVWELGLQGDFNFYRFMPGEPDFSFTPYITLGVSAFSYDPYAYLKGEKYFLRQLGTEGQGSADSTLGNQQPYSTMALAIPFGVGVKYALNERINIGFEIVHRFTNTDYLDDVSTKFVDPNVFFNHLTGNKLINALLLHNRQRGEIPEQTLPGKKRGDVTQKDGFFTLNIKLGLNIGRQRIK